MRDHWTWYNLSSAWAVWAFWGNRKTMLSFASTHSYLIDILSFGFLSFFSAYACRALGILSLFILQNCITHTNCHVQVMAPWQVDVSGLTDIWVTRGSCPRCVRSSPGARWRMTGGYLAKQGGRVNWLIGPTLLSGKLIHLSRRKDLFKLPFNFTLMCRMKDNFHNWIQFQIHITDRKKLQMK